jgi:L-iditol 2-dehydrogenase
LKAAILVRKKRMEIKEIEVPRINKHEMLIKIISTGICGSDVHVFSGESPFNYPVAIGHEIIGTVIKFGSNVTDFKVNDRIVVFPVVFCKKCSFCINDRYNLCDNMIAMGEAPTNGGFAQYVKVNKEMAVKVPDEFSLYQAALIEPAAVASHAINISEVKINNKVVIFGAGTIGLMVIATLNYMGIKDVTVIDVIDSRLKIAAKLGAKRIINLEKDKLPSNWPVRSFGSPNLYKAGEIDVIYDCVNVEDTFNKSLEILTKGGKLIVVGEPSGDIMLKSIPLKLLVIGEIKIMGSCIYLKEDFYRAMDIIRKTSEITKVITKEYSSIDNTQEAFEEFIKTKNKNIKILVLS